MMLVRSPYTNDGVDRQLTVGPDVDHEPFRGLLCIEQAFSPGEGCCNCMIFNHIVRMPGCSKPSFLSFDRNLRSSCARQIDALGVWFQDNDSPCTCCTYYKPPSTVICRSIGVQMNLAKVSAFGTTPRDDLQGHSCMFMQLNINPWLVVNDTGDPSRQFPLWLGEVAQGNLDSTIATHGTPFGISPFLRKSP